MRGGFKGDKRLTALLRKNHLFLDRHSEAVYDIDQVPHLILHGQDMTLQRERVFRRDRSLCKIRAKGCTREATELEHLQGGNYRRCDCEHNLRAVCNSCHRQKHNREVQLGRIGANER